MGGAKLPRRESIVAAARDKGGGGGAAEGGGGVGPGGHCSDVIRCRCR